MVRLLSALTFILLFHLLPLVGKPALMLHFKTILLILGSLCVWITQPSLSAQEARENRRSDRNSVFLILGMSVLSLVTPILDWAYLHDTDRYSMAILVAGVLCLCLGIGLRVWAIRTLGKMFTATVQIQQGHSIIMTGPYALVRHPSYLGFLISMVGCCLILESWIGLCVSLCAMSVAYYFRIQQEERVLLQSFGERYLQYQKRTNRMIPKVW